MGDGAVVGTGNCGDVRRVSARLNGFSKAALSARAESKFLSLDALLEVGGLDHLAIET